jgi:hypothetical protein
MQTLSPDVETLHQALHRAFPGARTVSVNEPCDTGADASTFEVLRTGGDLVRPPKAEDLPFATERFVRPEKSYQVSSRIDHTGMVQALDVWGGARDGRSPDGAPLPLFTFVNFTLTDAAFHAGGPYSDIARASVHDSDARLGQILDAVERSGAFDRTAFFLVADHGMGARARRVGRAVPRRGLRLRLRRRVTAGERRDFHSSFGVHRPRNCCGNPAVGRRQATGVSRLVQLGRAERSPAGRRPSRRARSSALSVTSAAPTFSSR